MKVSVITVNYKQAELTCQMLRSLSKVECPDMEVIVVDNASNNDDQSKIMQEFPNINYVQSKQNVGFAGGNNIGIAAAKGDFLLLINNDTELTPNCIKLLLQTFDQYPQAGVVCPKICYYEQPEKIQYVGYSRINPYTARNRTIGNGQIDKGQYPNTMPTHYAHGAAMMLKKEVIERVGKMPEEFFLYYEELDWCEQIKKAGYQIYVNPQARIYHKESMTTGKQSPLKTYYLTRNRILFMRRNANKYHWYCFVIFLMTITVPKNLLTYLLKAETQYIKPFWNAIRWNFVHEKHQPYFAARF